ncbi:MAG: nuclear transport factor 2 family protein [Bacteroidota bacterium]
MKSYDSNKEVVLAFYQEVIGNRNIELAKQLIAEDYIQHNPLVKTGLAGVLEAIEYLKQFPVSPPSSSPLRRILVDEDLVAVHLWVKMGPTEQLVMDIFRLDQGKLVEHWDAIQLVDSQKQHGESMIDGPVDIRDRDSTQKNKDLVQQYLQSVHLKKAIDQLDQFVHHELIHHQAHIAEGFTGLKHHLLQPSSLKLTEVHRIVGEGNFVLSQSKAFWEEREYVCYDLFRLEKEKIIETWRVKQVIPENMAHENGMI